MKIFNRGGRLFTHHEVNIAPGKFTDIPEQYEEAMKKLLADYSNELVTGDDARVIHSNAAATINELKAENTKLASQVAKLQKLLIETPAPETPKVDVDQLHARIHELETALSQVKTKTPRKQQI